MTQDNMVICYEGIQRIYRNAVVHVIRNTLKSAFPNEYMDKLRSPLQKEWNEIKRNATLVRQTGEISSDLVDDFDILSVNHFYNLFERYYNVFFPNDATMDDSEKKRRRNSILSWFKTVKDYRDPLSHPAEEDFSREDAFQLLDSARRILDRLGLESEVILIKSCIDKILGASQDATKEPLEAQLPHRDSIVVNFVGRDTEINILWGWLLDPHSKRWALAGEGGKGKSALAYNFAIDVKNKAPEPFQAIFWLSAKKRKFLEGQSVTANPEFTDLDSALSRILTYFGWVDEIVKPVEQKRERVLGLLNSSPTLVVVDDIDSLESENESAIEFFSLDLPTTRSKVLFTSRRTIFGMGATTTHISGFSLEEAEIFIKSRCIQMDLDIKLFEGEIIHRIVKVTEGSPLFIEDLMRLSASLPVSDAIKVWEEKEGNEARKYALGRECEMLSPNAKKVLIASCISPSAISFAEIESVSNLSRETVASAIRELQKIFLVPKPKLVEGEQRFDVNLNTKSLVRDLYGSDDIFRRIEGIYKSLSGNISKNARESIGAIIRQAFFLQKDHKLDAENLLLQAIWKYPGEPDLYGVLGRIYKNWNPPRIIDAREAFKRAWQLKCVKPEMYDIWCYMEIDEGEFTKAVDAAEKGLKYLPENKKLLYIAGQYKSRIAKELIRGLQNDKAQKELNDAVRYLEKALSASNLLDSRDKVLNSLIYRALVLSYEMLKDVRNLEKYFREWFFNHSNDAYAYSEWERISKKIPLSFRPPPKT